MQQRKVITLRNEKLLPRSVALLEALLGAVEDARDREHRDDRENLGGALAVDRDDEHLGEGGVHGKVGHLAAERGEFARVVERTEDPELVHRVEDVFLQVVRQQNSRVESRRGRT